MRLLKGRYMALVLALHAALADACGYCIEDKVASVYDYSIVTATLERKHQMAFFAIEGALPGDAATGAMLKAVVESTPGVDKGSVRVSIASAALAFGFDPRRTSLAKVISPLDANLARQGLSLALLQVMDRSMVGRRADTTASPEARNR
jgi:hypothetical protein